VLGKRKGKRRLEKRATGWSWYGNNRPLSPRTSENGGDFIVCLERSRVGGKGRTAGVAGAEAALSGGHGEAHHYGGEGGGGPARKRRPLEDIRGSSNIWGETFLQKENSCF